MSEEHTGNMKANIHFLVMDVDGTLTDGKIYMSSQGESFKKFDIKDGYGIALLLPKMGIEPVIITARKSSIVQHRCEELGIKLLFQGEKDKLSALNRMLSNYNAEKGTNYTLYNCVYMGDDIIDLPCMQAIREQGGLAVCPADAVFDVKSVCNYVCEKNAGSGAVRELIEWLKTGDTGSTLQERVNQALVYLQNLDAENLICGRYKVDSGFYYSVQKYDTKNVSECIFESHKKYVDIHLVVKGTEIIDVADISRCSYETEYDTEKDIMFWGEPSNYIRTTLQANDYIILYPEHAHRGAVSKSRSEQVLKIVGKVRFE